MALFLLPILAPGLEENVRVVAITFFVAHRYFTFSLVYMDRVEFARRKWTYLLVPFICIAGVWLCYHLRIDEPEMFAFWWFFNYFHFVRQKYGIVRIYSGKTRWGIKRLDELVTYGWGAAGLLHMLVYQTEVEGRLMHYLAINHRGSMGSRRSLRQCGRSTSCGVGPVRRVARRSLRLERLSRLWGLACVRSTPCGVSASSLSPTWYSVL